MIFLRRSDYISTGNIYRGKLHFLHCAMRPYLFHCLMAFLRPHEMLYNLHWRIAGAPKSLDFTTLHRPTLPNSSALLFHLLLLFPISGPYVCYKSLCGCCVRRHTWSVFSHWYQRLRNHIYVYCDVKSCLKHHFFSQTYHCCLYSRTLNTQIVLLYRRDSISHTSDRKKCAF